MSKAKVFMLVSGFYAGIFTIDLAVNSHNLMLWSAGMYLIVMFMSAVWEISEAIRSLKDK